MIFTPRPFQPPAIKHVLDAPYCGLWIDMGLGKTSITLSAVADLIDQLQARRTLVVAPLRVAKLVWAQEIAKWDHTSHLRTQLIRGTPEERRRQIRADADIHIVNYEHLKWLVTDLNGKWPWDVVICDEASKLKNPQSWRFRALKHVRPKIERLIELTGTPASAGLDGVWGQAYLLDEGKRLFKTKTMFRDRWFIQADRDGRQWTARDGALEEVTERLRDIVYCLRAEDHLDLPPLIENTLEVQLSAAQLKDYRKLEREMFLALEDGAIDAPTAAATSMKCLQYANGACYIDQDEGQQGNKPWAVIHDLKIDALESVIEEAAGEPVLVAYNFRSDLARLQKHFPDAVILTDNPKVEAAWNRGEIPILLAHPASAGHGLNLQGGGRIIVFFGLNWSLELYQQIIERLGPVRQLQAGTPRSVFVHHIVAQGTVDELVMQRLQTHASTQDVLRQAMRRR